MEWSQVIFQKLTLGSKCLARSGSKLFAKIISRQVHYISQAEARKAGLHRQMGLEARIPDVVACKQQKGQTSLCIRAV